MNQHDWNKIQFDITASALSSDVPTSEIVEGILSGRGRSAVDVAALHDLLTTLVSCVQTQDRQITALREELNECLYRIDTANL